MTVYRVNGRRRFRDHEPGETFEADLTPDEEKRALQRGAIRIVKRTIVNLDPSSVRPPRVKA